MMATIGLGKVQCKFCSLQLIYLKDMMFSHLGYHPQGGGKGRVGLCAKARPQMKALFVRCGGNDLITLDNAQAFGSLPNLVNDRSSGSFDNSFVASPQANGVDCSPLSRPSMDDPIPMSNLPPWQMGQMTLQQGMNSTMKQNLDKKWSTFFHETNIPFNVAHHSAFIDAAKFYLWKQNTSKEDLLKCVAERIKNSIHKYGATICSNGWDKANSHPLLNIMLVCPNGDLFLGAINTTRDQKDAQYICNALAKFIQNVGVSCRNLHEQRF